MCEKYNGWTNRETWALDLWLSNDQSLYLQTLAVARDASETWDAKPQAYGSCLSNADVDNPVTDRYIGEAIQEFWEELTDPDSGLMAASEILKMVRDIGSDYRINWDEIGSHWHPRNFE